MRERQYDLPSLSQTSMHRAAIRIFAAGGAAGTPAPQNNVRAPSTRACEVMSTAEKRRTVSCLQPERLDVPEQPSAGHLRGELVQRYADPVEKILDHIAPWDEGNGHLAGALRQADAVSVPRLAGRWSA